MKTEKESGELGEIVVAVATDSLMCPRRSVRKLYGDRFAVVPLTFTVDGRSYRDGSSRPAKFVPQIARATTKSTSAPDPDSFVATYERLWRAGYSDIISIHTPAELSSGTERSVVDAAAIVAESCGVRVHYVNSGCVSIGTGWQVTCALEMAEQRASVEAILAVLADMKSRTRLLVVLSDLKSLKVGGRISEAESLYAALKGSDLPLKAMLQVEAGVIQPLPQGMGRALTFKAAYQAIAWAAQSWKCPLERVATSSIAARNSERELVAFLRSSGVFTGLIPHVPMNSGVIAVYTDPPVVAAFFLLKGSE